MKKLATQISFFMKEILNEDKETFNVELGSIGNKIFEYYSNREIDKISIKSRFSEKIQFNMTKDNEDILFTVLKEHNYSSESHYMRDVIFTYINNPRYKREEILFFQKFQDVRDAIEQKRKLNIKYNNEVRTISPYFIKVADRENRNYLFCYCEKNDDYRCYKISEIKNIMLSKNELEIKNKEYIDGIFKNFDPFRSYGKEVKAKLTKKGIELLKKVTSNRPKILKENDDYFIFECDEKLAQIYFAQFFSEIEILEPENLRKWFKDIYKKAYDKYN